MPLPNDVCQGNGILTLTGTESPKLHRGKLNNMFSVRIMQPSCSTASLTICENGADTL